MGQLQHRGDRTFDAAFGSAQAAQCDVYGGRISRWFFLLMLVLALPAFAQGEVQNTSQGYSPPEELDHETLRFTGYLDVGFAKVFGSGSSFSPGDTRVPADYGVDAFAPAINSRGEVASTRSDYFTNGFLPRSVGIDGRPSFLLNTASVDVRFTPSQIPLMVFMRLQLMPRFIAGTTTRVDLQQAFGKLSPFTGHEFAVSIGKFDSVFGIEYLSNEANLRTGITPSLIARYTTGQSLGIKALYRFELPALWSAVSLNAAATTSGTRIEALVNPHISTTGVPVGSARLGYELQLQHLQVKLGGSGLYGPRNDQSSVSARQYAVGGDLRITSYGVSLQAELLRLIDEPGPILQTDGKMTGQGPAELASGFTVHGYYGTLAWALPYQGEVLNRVTLYGRYEERVGAFQGFTPVHTRRLTAGLRVDLWQYFAVKVEGLLNQEISGAPDVPNDVFTSSVVFSW